MYNFQTYSIKDIDGYTIGSINLDAGCDTLRYSDFSDMNLHGACIDDLDLSYANFNGATLIGATFFYTCLENATFIGADLSGVSFVGVNLSNVDFTGANLDGVEFCNKSLLYDVNFKDANISSDTIEIAKIEGCKFN